MTKIPQFVNDCKLAVPTLKEISRFSAPQMFIRSSYPASWKKYFLLIANKPPGIVGELKY